MYKVLVYGMTTNPGGVENIIINYYRHFNHKKIKMDFIANTPEKMAYEDELVKSNSIVYHVSSRKQNPFKYYKDMGSLFKRISCEYDCLWANLNSLTNITAIKLAKKNGIKRIIVHSHNSSNMDTGFIGYIRGIIHKYNKKKIADYGDEFWACTREAAKWLYPQTILPQVHIINNAIDVSKNSFNLQKKNHLLEKYKLKDNFIIGNVGRLQSQKNQLFLINIFNKVQYKLPQARLILVGDGPDKNKIIKKIQELSLSDKVIMAGIQEDMQAWYSLFDLFVFPSKFEGLAVALLEAQANGLNIFASKYVISSVVCINKNFKFISLKDNWSSQIIDMYIEKKIRRCCKSEIKRNFAKHGFDINVEAVKLQEIFLKGSSTNGN